MNTEQQVKYLELELRQVRHEAALLRKQIGANTRHVRRIQKAYQDALLLATWKMSGIPPSRSYAKRHGMTQNCWQNAVALLRMARVIIRHRHWALVDVDRIEQRLDKARQTAMDMPEAFFCRLNKHGAP